MKLNTGKYLMGFRSTCGVKHLLTFLSISPNRILGIAHVYELGFMNSSDNYNSHFTRTWKSLTESIKRLVPDSTRCHYIHFVRQDLSFVVSDIWDHIREKLLKKSRKVSFATQHYLDREKLSEVHEN